MIPPLEAVAAQEGAPVTLAKATTRATRTARKTTI